MIKTRDTKQELIENIHRAKQKVLGQENGMLKQPLEELIRSSKELKTVELELFKPERMPIP